MEYWGMYVIAALICLLCVVACTPNAWADKFIAKFNIHPKLNADSTVKVNGSALAGEDKQQFIDSFNNAEFRYTYNLTHQMPSYEGKDIQVTATVARNKVNFIVHPFDDHIDIVKQIGKKVIQYRVESNELQRTLLLHE